jgi:hypothetical protein
MKIVEKNEECGKKNKKISTFFSSLKTFLQLLRTSEKVLFPTTQLQLKKTKVLQAFHAQHAALFRDTKKTRRSTTYYLSIIYLRSFRRRHTTAFRKLFSFRVRELSFSKL